MKSKKIIIGFLIALSLWGCDDILDTTPFSVITSQNMWQTESDAKAGIVGMYSRFRATYNTEIFLIWFEFRSGFWMNGASGAGQWDNLYLNTPSSTSTPGIDWNNIYKVINQANLAIKYLPELDFTVESNRQNLLADAYFMRAFCYFSLARIWGDVPIVIEPVESIDDPNLYPARADVADVFTQIKADIDLASANMVDVSIRSRVMASRAGINMLKADVYLWTAKRLGGGAADLTVAQTASEAVLADANYGLTTTYDEAFRVEQNKETIFSIYFTTTEGSQNQYGQRFTFQSGQVASAYRNNPVPIGSSAQWHVFNTHYVNNYLSINATDSRRLTNYQTFTGGGKTYRWVNKYLGEIISGTRNAISDTRIYRFAEAILFKAEAMNGLGNTTDAIIELNKIAKRAYGLDDYYPPTLTQDEVDAAILNERLIEFGAEGKSWFDFIRFGKAFELIPTLVGRENDYQGNILLLPVHPSTITNNLNVVQTPGY